MEVEVEVVMLDTSNNDKNDGVRVVIRYFGDGSVLLPMLVLAAMMYPL